MGEGDQVNIFFLLLLGEVGGWACPCLESSPRWQVKMVGPELGTVLSPKSHGEGGPWCATLWASWQLSIHPCPSEPGQKNVGGGCEAGQGSPSPPCKAGLGLLVHLPSVHCPSPSQRKLIHTLPSPDSSPPISICPPSIAPSGYVTILFPMPAPFTRLHSSPGLPHPFPQQTPNHTTDTSPHHLHGWVGGGDGEGQGLGELFLALRNRFTFPNLAF